MSNKKESAPKEVESSEDGTGYKEMLDSVPTPVMAVDTEFNITYMNNAGAQALGQTPENCIGQKCFNLFNTEDCHSGNCQVKKAMQQKGDFTNDTVAKLPSGELPIRYTGTPLKDENGDVIGGLEYVLDISKEMEITEGVTELAEAAVEGKLDARADVEKFKGNYRKIIEGVNNTLDAVIGPLNVAAEYIDRISKGDIPDYITDEYKGDFNEIKNNLNKCIESVNGLVAEAGKLTDAAVEGKLDTRGDPSQFSGDYAQIVQGVNDTLDAVIQPLNVAAEYIDRISKGDIPEEITDEYKGDFNEIKNNLNKCIESVNGLVAEAGKLADAAVEGKLDTRGDSTQFSGDYAKIVQGVNNTLDAVIEPLNVAAEYIDRISKGDIPEEITEEYKGDFNEIKNNLNKCIESVNGLVAEADKLTDAAVEGKLDTRGDPSQFSGDWAQIVQGVNDIVNTTVGHIDQIPTPFMIVDPDYNIRYMNAFGASVLGTTQSQLIGKKCYSQFKTSDCQTANCAVNRAMNSGKSETSETDAHPGDKEMFISYTGVPMKNRQGATIGALEIVMDQTEVKKAMNDAQIKVEYLNSIPTPVMAVDKEFNVQFMNPAGAQALGQTPEQCVGQKCFSLFNTEHCNTENCQLKKAMQQKGEFTDDTVAKIPSGELPIRYTGTPLKDENGDVIGGLEYVLDISKEMEITEGVTELAEAAVEGKLDARADVEKFKGNYRKIVEGVNDTLDAVIQPLNVAAEYVDRISKGDIPEEITDEYKGDFNEIKNNLNQCIANFNWFVSEMNRMSDEHDAGDIDVRIPADKFQGVYSTMAQGVNDMVEGHINVKKKAMACVDEFGKGNFDAEIEQFPGKKAFINDIIERVRTNLKSVGTEVSQLVNAALEGDLDTRADTSQFEGDWKELVEGVNQTLDAVIEPLRDIDSTLDKIADGDLSARVVNEYKGEFEELKRTVNSLGENLGQVISQIDEVSSEVNSTSEQLTASIQEISSTSRSVSDTSQKVSSGIEQQTTALENTKKQMEEMSGITEETASSAENVLKIAKEASEEAETGYQASNNTKSTMDELYKSNEEVNNEVQALEEKAEKIGEIVSIITKISEQTSLLALNANIEAARVGEEGKGFAVVAGEVGKLANETQESAQNISNLIKEIQDSKDRLVNSVKESGNKTEETSKAVKEVMEKIESMKKAIDDTSNGMEEIKKAMDDQSETIQKVTSEADQVYQTATSNAKEVENTAAATEEQTSSIDEISKSSEGLSKMADNLIQTVKQFNLEKEQKNQ